MHEFALISTSAETRERNDFHNAANHNLIQGGQNNKLKIENWKSNDNFVLNSTIICRRTCVYNNLTHDNRNRKPVLYQSYSTRIQVADRSV